MHGFDLMGKHIKGRVLILILVSLCLLVPFISEPGKPVESFSPPVSMSADAENYALLPVLFRVDDTMFRARLNKGDRRAVTALDTVVPVGIYGYVPSFTADSYPICKCLGPFDNIFRKVLQHACRLLDIPPPCEAFSLQT